MQMPAIVEVTEPYGGHRSATSASDLNLISPVDLSMREWGERNQDSESDFNPVSPPQMPLAISTPGPGLWSSPAAQQRAGDELFDHLPEVLARDLQLSASIFAARRMTAGKPAPLFSSELPTASRLGKMAPSSPYLATSARVKSLGAIQERASVVSFPGQDEELRSNDVASILGSSSSADSAEDPMAPPPVRHRESSGTIATSLASTAWKPSARGSALPDRSSGSSWIDDSAGEDHEDHDAVGHATAPASSPSLIAASPHSLGRQRHGAWHRDSRQINSRGIRDNDCSHRRSNSLNSAFGDRRLSSFRRQASARSLDPFRRSVPLVAAGPGRYYESREMVGNEPASLPNTASHSRQIDPLGPHPLASSDAVSAGRCQPRHRSLDGKALTHRPQPEKADATSLEGEPVARTPVSPPARPLDCPPAANSDTAGAESIQASFPGPRPALRSVQSWLISSLQPWPKLHPGDDMARVVPLPPDAMETLRVSIACFPETMLLSSSLTMDTIRTYSKKARRPSLDSGKNNLLEAPVLAPCKRLHLWRRVMPLKRSATMAEAKLPIGRTSNDKSSSSSDPDSDEGPKLWTPIKNVFGCCSDYICDALYAHLVAYNYISALVARHPQLASPCRASRWPGPRAVDCHQEDIPKKAASILGLAATTDQLPTEAARISRRLSSPLGIWPREEMVAEQPTASSVHEKMQHGLLRCICRLVATAKLMAERGTGEEFMLDMQAEKADVLLIRSLCEVVRMAEESIG